MNQFCNQELLKEVVGNGFTFFFILNLTIFQTKAVLGTKYDNKNSQASTPQEAQYSSFTKNDYY